MPRISPLWPFAAYLVLGIFYVFPSGLPQPADAVLLAGIGGMMLFGRFRLVLSGEEVLAIIALATWTYAVNCWYFVQIGDLTFLKKALFYLYNLGFFAAAISAARLARPGEIRILFWAAFAALILEFLLIILRPELIGRRQIGSFNNPNQLAYWALLNAGVMFLALISCRRAGLPITLGRMAALGAILITGFVIGESLSKAGFAAYLAMVALMLGPIFGLRPVTILCGAILAVAVAVIVIPSGDSALAFGQSLNLDFTDKLIRRFTHVQADDSLTSRGYFRLLEMPQFLIAGAGEGAFWRVSASAGKEVEIHSTPVHFITSYGLIGLGFLGAFAAVFLRRLTLAAMAILVAILIYGLAHNGLRFTHLWLVLALIAAQCPTPAPRAARAAYA